MYRRSKHGANDHEDMVTITLGSLRPRVAYQTAFEIAHSLRLACKAAARYDRVPANFWLDVNIEDLDDCPRPHRGFRRSKLAPNVTHWQVSHLHTEVQLIFDGRGEILGYEDGIKLHQRIRRAGRRAKAWAGESTKGHRMLSMITDAEEDYKFGLI